MLAIATICRNPMTWVAAFCFIYLAAWAANGLCGTKFVLSELRELAAFIIAKYGIDSFANSPKGEAPK